MVHYGIAPLVVLLLLPGSVATCADCCSANNGSCAAAYMGRAGVCCHAHASPQCCPAGFLCRTCSGLYQCVASYELDTPCTNSTPGKVPPFLVLAGMIFLAAGCRCLVLGVGACAQPAFNDVGQIHTVPREQGEYHQASDAVVSVVTTVGEKDSSEDDANLPSYSDVMHQQRLTPS